MLYRYTSTITTLNGSVVLVGIFTTTSGSDTVRKSGKWYYVVTAVNASGESGISNCQFCVIAIAPVPPFITSIRPNPSTNVTLFLSWTASSGATSFNLYRYTSDITMINGLVALVGTFYSTTGKDTGLVNGTYFYVVTAINASGESEISNCITIMVVIPPQSPQAPLPYLLIIIVSCIAVSIALMLVGLRHRKQRSITIKNRTKPAVPVAFQISTISSSEITPDIVRSKALQPSIKTWESIVTGTKAIWNPFEIASILGFKDNPELFYNFLSIVNEERAHLESGRDELLRFVSGQLVLNLAMSKEEKTWLVERFQQFLNESLQTKL